MSAKERLDIGDKLKNVRLGYFNSHHSNELTTIVTTDLTFLENFVAMKMVDVVVKWIRSNYSTHIVSTCSFVASIIISMHWRITISFFAIQLLERKSRQNAPAYHNVQNQLVEKVLEVIRGIQVIKSFAKENTVLKVLTKQSMKVNV
ncbi:hypothetical protein ACVXZZ_04665 [Staphylococcus aureus]